MVLQAPRRAWSDEGLRVLCSSCSRGEEHVSRMEENARSASLIQITTKDRPQRT